MRDKRKYFVGFFIFLIAGLLLWGIISQWSKISMILSFVFYGIVIAYLLVPISRWLEKYMPRSLAVILLFLAIISVLVLFFILIIPKFIKQLTTLIERLPNFTLQIKTAGKLQNFRRYGLPYSIQVTLNVSGRDGKRAISVLKENIDGLLDGAGRIAGPLLCLY